MTSELTERKNGRRWKGGILVLILAMMGVAFYLISGSSAPPVDFELLGCERVESGERVEDGDIQCRSLIEPGASEKQLRMVSKRIDKRVRFEFGSPVSVIRFYRSRDGPQVGDERLLARVVYEGGDFQITREWNDGSKPDRR